MSLVAYEYSSDEDNEEEEEASVEKNSGKSESNLTSKNINKVPEVPSASRITQGNTISDDEDDQQAKPLHFNLPAPTRAVRQSIPEEDDEFLRIKPTPTEKPPRAPVRIAIPSLSQFKDIPETSGKKKEVVKSTGCGLLDILPKPLSETLFQVSQAPEARKKQTLVPDSVMNRRGKVQKPATVAKSKKLPEKDEDSDGSDGGDDFFRLNTPDDLPEVSVNELNALIARKAAEIAATTSRFEQVAEIPDEDVAQEEHVVTEDGSALEDEALEKLVGRRAKRSRMEEINVVDIRGDQVLPNQEEWMRSALANSTEMPKGKPAGGAEAGGMSKRKHQITYLAHQAKTNEQELQAMWAANRQTRRQTQSKYGF